LVNGPRWRSCRKAELERQVANLERGRWSRKRLPGCGSKTSRVTGGQTPARLWTERVSTGRKAPKALSRFVEENPKKAKLRRVSGRGVG